MVLGEFDYEEMNQINPNFALGFFLFYQFFVFLIMVNIFLAILNDAYIAVKEAHDGMPKDDSPSLTLRQHAANLMAWLHQKRLDVRVERMRAEQRHQELKEKRARIALMQARAKTMRFLQGGNNATRPRPAPER